MTRISCRALTAGYGGPPVVRGVDLEVNDGEWLAVLGPNGSGKSTLLRAIAGTLPFGGEVTFNGGPSGRVARKELAKLVAMVPQNPVIPAGMAVLDYVLLGRTPYIPAWGTESSHDLRLAHQVLEDLDLAQMGDRPLGSLSGGELQRVVLARALTQQAPILLLDEPTTALDVGHQQQVLELVDALRRNRAITVLAAMHDLTLAAQYADRLILLIDGHPAAVGSAEEVLTAELVEQNYGAQVAILSGPDGELVVAPRRPGRRSEQEATTCT